MRKIKVRMVAIPTRDHTTATFGWNSLGFPYWCGNKTTVVWNVYFGINSLSKATIFHVSVKNFPFSVGF
jgi:hypothetical protein